MGWYSIEPRTRKCVKGYGFLSFHRKLVKELFDTRLGNNDPTRNYFNKCYMSLVEIKVFNVLIDNNQFFCSASKKQTRSVWTTFLNVKKWWLYNRKRIRLFVASKIL